MFKSDSSNIFKKNSLNDDGTFEKYGKSQQIININELEDND